MRNVAQTQVSSTAARCGQQHPALLALPHHQYRPVHFSQPGSPCLVRFRTLRSRCEERSRICARHKIRVSPFRDTLPSNKKKRNQLKEAHTVLGSFTRGWSASMWGSPSTTSRPPPQIHSSRNARMSSPSGRACRGTC